MDKSGAGSTVTPDRRKNRLVPYSADVLTLHPRAVEKERNPMWQVALLDVAG